MARPGPLTEAELASAAAELSSWEVSAEGLSRSLRFADFSAAFGFLARVALEAEKLDHHPGWSNVWNRVDITLTTHDAGGVTALDLDLARRIDAIAGAAGATAAQ